MLLLLTYTVYGSLPSPVGSFLVPTRLEYSSRREDYCLKVILITKNVSRDYNICFHLNKRKVSDLFMIYLKYGTQ